MHLKLLNLHWKYNEIYIETKISLQWYINDGAN